MMMFGVASLKFLSTPSARRATAFRPTRPSPSSNFYPRPPRGGRHRPASPGERTSHISIHALREEGDLLEQTDIGSWIMISIHALREEGDCVLTSGGRCWQNFYPRPPRGGRLGG